MTWRAALPGLLLLALGAIGCTPEPVTTALGASAPSPTPTVALGDPTADAAALVRARFGATGEADRVTSVTLRAGLLRVTLDLPITTMGAADTYMRMCNALAPMIGTDGVKGVQTFGPGGAVVATGSPTVRCSKFFE